ncbi:MAG: hypothetical protein HW387_847 [Parachlamydiales bacterium]|nr:hypothetical protein [Parachlamydiales bacterium]
METIGIVTYKVPALNPWDPDTINRGIAGSEEAVIYVSQKLAALGYQVIVFADPPRGSVHSAVGANPRFIDLNQIHQFSMDIAVSWRMPGIGKELKRCAKKVYLWPEDTLHEKVRPDQVFAFDDCLWVSQWQRKQWMSLTPEFARFTRSFGNAINPEEFGPAQERENPYSCIYGSNYARGLEIMLRIWPAVKQHYPKATLDIYYGWQHWGCLAPAKEAWMRKTLPALQDVKEHGLVGHAELNQAYSNTSFWTYPCIMPETFCTSGIRAQMGGAIPVIIEGSVLSETVRHGFRCQRPEDYLATLLKAMSQAEKIQLDERQKMQEFVLQEYTWEKIAAGWAEVFKS